MKQIISLSIFCLLSSACASQKNVQTSDYTQEIVQHQKKYMEDFIKDERAPLEEKDLKDIHFYPPNEVYKCDCTVTLTPDEKPFELSTYSGKTKPYRQYGYADCTIEDKSIQIRLYTNLRLFAMPGFKNHLFVPFKDWTNGEETYGGGRYIDLKTNDIVDGKVTIDFNKCYNPWCAYSDGYNCPIPPIENRFELEIKAGEKMWTGKKKKAK